MKQSILFAVVIMFSLVAHAQVKDSLVADETTWSRLKASIKIVSTNETVYNKMMDYFLNPSVKGQEARAGLIRNTNNVFEPSRKFVIYFYPYAQGELTRFFATLNK